MSTNLSTKDEGDVLYENEYHENVKTVIEHKPLPKRTYELHWPMIIFMTSFHLGAIYATYLIFTSAKLLTTAFVVSWFPFIIFSVTAGPHRLWAHRSYKATWQLKLLLMIGHTISFQHTIFIWARDHRIHHKFTDTDADPHNSRRGFFYAHIGWLLCKPLPEAIEKGKLIDFSDLKNDPIVKFQIRYYIILTLLFSKTLPILIPWYFWNETVINAWFIAVMWRFVLTVHLAFIINSIGHFWGTRPYDKNYSATDNFMFTIITLGEGWHNYHHAFPWDYKTSEFGASSINITTWILNQFAKIGWAYDLKTVSDDMIQKRIKRTGDGTHSSAIWGWGDTDQTHEQKQYAIQKYARR